MGDAETPGRVDETLGDVDHANPYTGEAFGETQTYGRGRLVAADGGRAGAEDADATLADVSHAPPGGADGAQRAYTRGERDE